MSMISFSRSIYLETSKEFLYNNAVITVCRIKTSNLGRNTQFGEFQRSEIKQMDGYMTEIILKKSKEKNNH